MKKITLLILSYVFCLMSSATAQTIAGGYQHSLAVCRDSTVRAWGRNDFGQLGNGTYDTSNVPVQVISLSGISAVTGGGWHSLALKNDGTVWAWGRNNHGQLGNGINDSSNVPVQVSILSGITAVAGGGGPSEGHSLALKNDGTVWAWGRNFFGQLGNGNTTDSNVPVQVSAPSGIIAIEGGYLHSLALKNDGTVWAWGRNNYGQLGNGTNTTSNVPVQVSALSGITAIAAGGYHSFVLKNDGTVYAWGFNSSGTLGNGTNIDSNVPVQVSALSGITAIAGGLDYSFVLKNDGTMLAWGYNAYGTLGNGTNIDSNVPVQVSALSGITAIAGGGGAHTLALQNDGTARAWGFNFFGQLGIGTFSFGSNVPVQVTGLCPVLMGVKEENIVSTINIFPNPATTQVTLNLVKAASYNIQLTNTLGELLEQAQINSSSHALDVSIRPRGIYFVTVSDEAGNKTVRKIVKM